MRKSGYDFYLDDCLLPIAPDKLEIKVNNANATLTLINEGEVNVLKTPELTDVEFECIIPQTKYPFASYKSDFQEASYFLDRFEQLKAGKAPFQFIVCRITQDEREMFSTNMKVSLEEYKITEQAKNGFDLVVKIKLKQYREYGTKAVKLKKGKGKVEKKRAGKPKRKDYRVGDIVNFHGGKHYYSSYPGAKGYSAKAGRAKITIANGSGKAHPWHLIHTDSSSNVYGWVDNGTFD